MTNSKWKSNNKKFNAPLVLWWRKFDTLFPSPPFPHSRCAAGSHLRKCESWWTVHCDMLWHELERLFLSSVPEILSFTHFPFQSSTRNRNVHGQTRLLNAKRHFRASHVGISSHATKRLRMKFLLSEFRALLKKSAKWFYFSLSLFLVLVWSLLITVCSLIFEWKSI